jgi:hypothetical protein
MGNGEKKSGAALRGPHRIRCRCGNAACGCRDYMPPTMPQSWSRAAISVPAEAAPLVSAPPLAVVSVLVLPVCIWSELPPLAAPELVSALATWLSHSDLT